MRNEYDAEEINDLLMKAKSGDNGAWTKLYEEFEAFIHRVAWDRIKGLNLEKPHETENELFQAGWIGFARAIRRFEPGRSGFLTYAKNDIEGAMSEQLRFEFDDGITHKPQEEKIVVERPKDDSEEEMQAFEAKVSGAAFLGRFRASSGMSVGEPTDHEKFRQGRRILQILEVLKMLTDEDHSISKADLLEQLHYYRVGKYGNDSSLTVKKGELGLHSDDNTYTSDLEDMLRELDPLTYTGTNDDDYRIKYSSYKDDGLNRKINKVKGRKALPITDFSYNHDFDNETLDKLIQLVSFSDIFSNEEKSQLINKLVSTASVYYHTPFLDGDDIRFNPAAIHGRFSQRNGTDRKLLAENLKTIRKAINSLAQIRFRFNRYTADHKLVPKYEHISVLSPYHMVVYHDNYYVIGLNQVWGDQKRVLHYRVDLMSDIEIATDEEGKIIPIEVCAFDGLPISNAYWDPEKYMSEHINMGYDLPRDIKIKIPEDDYTLIHSWFGDHYRKIDSVTETVGDGSKVNYDIVVVKTSPYMIVHWAMQYGTAVEILDEEIREKIREELKKMRKRYE
ncbi:MAG: WYL domain-containing protein [Lachnospiraceae bacterium]|nr:WYL domain-containing protein [Lachnospiraceae bacterium]